MDIELTDEEVKILVYGSLHTMFRGEPYALYSFDSLHEGLQERGLLERRNPKRIGAEENEELWIEYIATEAGDRLLATLASRAISLFPDGHHVIIELLSHLSSGELSPLLVHRIQSVREMACKRYEELNKWYKRFFRRRKR